MKADRKSRNTAGESTSQPAPNSHRTAADAVSAPPGVQRSFFQWTLIGIKLALVALIAWLSFSTLAAFFEWGRGPKQVAAVENRAMQSSIQPPTVPPVLLSAFDDGAWEFAGMPWQVRIATVQAKDLDRELEAIPPADQLTGGASSEDSQKLLTMLRMTGAKERDLGQFKLLQSNSSTGRMVLVSRAGPTGDEVVLGRIAWPEGGSWRFVEGRPATAAVAKKTDAPFCPPLPADAKLLGTRWADDGTLLGRIASLPGTRGELVASWKEAGWSVGRAPMEMSSADDVALLLVEQDGVGFSAHFYSSPDGPTTLFLTRVPD